MDTIREQLESGAPIKGAAAYAGVPTRTLYDWLARGRNGSGSPLERELADVVVQAVERAKADVATRLWREEDWRAAAWVAERRWPDEYGQPARRVEHGGAIGVYPANALTPERLREAVESGEFSAEEVATANRFWRWVLGQGAGEVVEGEALELGAGEAA